MRMPRKKVSQSMPERETPKFKPGRMTSRNESDQSILGNEKNTPLRLLRSETLGRYLVARRSLEAGEAILRDEAIVVGPCQESRPLCIGCYSSINLNNSTSYKRCSNCAWPLCSEQCSGIHKVHGHSKEECDYLAGSMIKNKEIHRFSDYYYAVTPFRCLILKGNNPKNWDLIKSMEAHTEKRREAVDLWRTNQERAVNVIRHEWGLLQLQQEDIHLVCGVLEINAFEVTAFGREGEPYLRAVYPTSFLFAHNCVPNVSYSNGPDFQMIFRTTTEISPDQMLNISYAYALQSTPMRREHLEKAKFFSCTCKRCSDPSEMGTFTGAMKCQLCKHGIVLPRNPLERDSLWTCSTYKCNFETRTSQIKPILNGLFNELDSIDGNNVSGYEKFIKKCEKLFHKNHYLCLSAMHCLSRIYGKIDGFLITELSDELLQRKIDICKRLIGVFEILQPGLSKEKGILLYEVHAPLMVLLRRRFERGEVNGKELKLRLSEIIKYLEEARMILSKEPENSSEAQMNKAIDEALIALKNS